MDINHYISDVSNRKVVCSSCRTIITRIVNS